MKKPQKVRKRDGGLILFGLIFVSVGLGLLGMSFSVLLEQSQPDGWVKTPCEIEELVIADSAARPLPFSLNTRFRYHWQGAEHVGMQCFPDGHPFAAGIHEELEIIRSKKLATPVCFVNSAEPRNASLFPYDSGKADGIGLFVAGGIIFTCVGIGMIRSGRNPTRNGFLLVSTFGFFLVAGIYLSARLLVVPAFKYVETRSWEKCDATVIWSKVRQARSKGGNRRISYYPDVFFEYQYEGTTHRSNNVNNMRMATNIGSYARDMVARNRKGAHVTCHVNPKNPGQAVLDRGIGWRWLMGLFPLPFLAMGGLGVYLGIGKLRKKLKSATMRAL